MAKGNSDLGEQALSKAFEVGLSTQLDAADDLDADIRTNPIALMQGELESAEIQGRGLVIKNDLRTEQLSVKTDGIAIDPLKAAFGNIELTRPTNASAAVELTEVDIERACNSDYIQQKLKSLDVTLDGRPVQVSAEQIDFSLPGNGQVAIAASVLLEETGERQQVAFRTTPAMGPQGHEVVLNDVQIEPENTSEPLTQSLLVAAKDLLNLHNFTLSGMTLQLQSLDVQPGKIALQMQAYVEKFPGGQ
ncbi:MULTISPECIES: DUF2993 domain-containing protein [Cyanophyceae]|uniref:LmeA family phospholipid-binding protein n=1 Tax=Cyanophyceae TaxID=3028117 RepID=UPI001682537D|nr:MULTISPECIES: DUF2993 domain-containing protein [Cyanophyceae]MBD1919248.1 DUF2993 domain-containing protein [Phormidium sp. FACHB-77]MBD2030958.1 DUF2993 domain-containing protein [Phormidium sp. FACHB-322]MBD2054271.1 DUF2993 domain-containing protein [Leptolyngbya sp. FACHB-60]